MTQYLLLIHGNAKSNPTAEEWSAFFTVAQESGLFQGGSEIGERVAVGDTDSMKSTEHLVGYMRFDSASREDVLELLKRHPVVLHGGAVELCEMPSS